MLQHRTIRKKSQKLVRLVQIEVIRARLQTVVCHFGSGPAIPKNARTETFSAEHTSIRPSSAASAKGRKVPRGSHSNSLPVPHCSERRDCPNTVSSSRLKCRALYECPQCGLLARHSSTLANGRFGPHPEQYCLGFSLFGGRTSMRFPGPKQQCPNSTIPTNRPTWHRGC